MDEFEKAMLANGIRTYVKVEKGGINIQEVHHFHQAKACLNEGKENVATDERSDLEKALLVVAEMAKEGCFKVQKDYFGAFKIIEERMANGLTTSEFCELMRQKTDLPDVLLPKNENIRKLYAEPKALYPNWKILKESITWVQKITDIAREILLRVSNG